MSKDTNPQTPALPSSCSLIATLSGIAVMSGVLVVLVHQWTLPRITENRQAALEQAVFTVLPGATVRSNLLVKTTGITALPSEEISTANAFCGIR